MLIYNEQRNEYSSDRPETHRVMVEGAEPYVGNAASKIHPPRTVKVIEVAVADLRPYTVDEYEAKVSELIRERYSDNEELAILRKVKALEMMPAIMAADDQGAGSARAAQIEREFLEYNAYAEECKRRAKEILSQPKNEEEETDENLRQGGEPAS